MSGFKLDDVSPDAYGEHGKAILDLFKQLLQAESKDEVEPGHVADKIQRYFETLESAEGVKSAIWEFWMVLVDVVRAIPLRAVRALAGAITVLRQTGGIIGGEKLESSLKWEDLPNCVIILRDVWFDPSESEAEATDEEMWKWYRLNVFTARITTQDFAPWLNLPIWNLRDALEERELKGVAMGMRLWIAYEWIEACQAVIFGDMTSSEELDEATARSLRTGEHCPEGISPRCIERWEYWKKRILETAARFDELELKISSHAGVIGKELWEDRAATIAWAMNEQLSDTST